MMEWWKIGMLILNHKYLLQVCKVISRKTILCQEDFLKKNHLSQFPITHYSIIPSFQYSNIPIVSEANYVHLFSVFFLHQYPQIIQKHTSGTILAKLWGKTISPRLKELKFGVHVEMFASS